jgi:PTH1 family peptidyl-tRNA hydrolase
MSGKYLIVGLGNPGRDYTKTRHNVGFHVVDELAKRHNITNFTTERKALVADGLINGKRVILAKPQTYMNLSGEAVRALLDYYKIDLDNLIVAHDDLDLPLGTLRLRKSGGHGGQNGMRNIILHLGTQGFGRVRFGIGRPPGKMRATDYVLQKFIEDDQILAHQVVEKAANAVEFWLENGMEAAMSQFNGDVNDAGTNNNGNKPKPDEQLKLAERAHELNPNDPKPLEEMARYYKMLRRLDDAARAHLQLAEVYNAKGDTMQMIRQWELATRVRPMLIEVREEIARTYEAKDDKKRAVMTWLALAEYHEKQGDLPAAIQTINEALRVNPQHPKALDMETEFKKRLTM